MKPRGYLYHQPLQNDDCFIGIESIPDNANQYRLGRVFLRNYYTVLDFEQNLIQIGPNAFSSQGAKAYIQGRVSNPYKHQDKPKGSNLGWLIVIIILMVAGAVYYYIKHNKKL